MAAPTLGRHIDTSSPRGYYLDYSNYARTEFECDGKGMPVVRVRGGSTAFSPLLAARVALGSLELYLENGNSERRDRFGRVADQLIERIEILPGSFGGWSMPEVPRAFRGRLPLDWFSATAHAECVAVLVRAALLLRLDGALEAATRALGAFYAGIDEGGFLREVGEEGHEGGVESLAFIEEYPIQGPPRMALAAHVRAVWSLHDYLGVQEDPGVRILLRRCVDGLVFALDRFDLGYWTCASLEGRRVRPASEEGHRTHALMMDLLAGMTGNAGFAEAASRWRGYAVDSGARTRARLTRAATDFANLGVHVTTY